MSLNPIRVLKNEADEEKAEVARLSSFVGAMAIGDLVKSTLGPKGMDKILWGMGRNEGEVEVTNDGATILKAIGVDNPAAKILVDASRVQVHTPFSPATSISIAPVIQYFKRSLRSFTIRNYWCSSPSYYHSRSLLNMNE